MLIKILLIIKLQVRVDMMQLVLNREPGMRWGISAIRDEKFAM